MISGSSGSGTDPQRWFLYLPVWATTKPPCSSEGSGSGGSASGSGVASSGVASSGSGGSEDSGRSGASSASGGSGGSGGGSGSAGSGASGGSGGSAGSGGSGGGGGGSGGGGGGSGGSGGPSLESSGNCFLHGTLVTLADGSLRPIEKVRPGDHVRSVQLPGLEIDVPRRSQYDWLARGTSLPSDHVEAVVDSVRLGSHDGFIVLNRRLKCTPEHPLLIRRGNDLGFASAELVGPGDELALAGGAFEAVRDVDHVPGRVKTVSIHVPRTNVYLADGAWAHNDVPLPPSLLSSSSGSASSGSESSGSGKSSGSSWGGI